MLRVREAMAELKLPALPASVGRARRFVTSQLASLGLEVPSDDAELLTSELVTNAVLHAGTDITVRVVSQESRIRIEVADDDPRLPSVGQPDGDGSTGRGLFIVEQLSEDWGIDSTRSGKIVWFTVAAAI